MMVGTSVHSSMTEIGSGEGREHRAMRWQTIRGGEDGIQSRDMLKKSWNHKLEGCS